MKSVALFVLLVFIVGSGAFVGSVVGASIDREGNADLFVGAWIGGLTAVWGGVACAAGLAWITRDQMAGVAAGTATGFVVTALVAMNRGSSLPAVLASILLIGAGGLLGRRFRRSGQEL